VKERIGFVYDEPCFPEDVSLKNIKRAIARFYPRWDEDVFQKLAARFELPLGKWFKKLSHGTKMKFALALALSHHADFILMDEPTAGLDPVFRRELLMHLRELLQDERKSILFSTHITTDLEQIADFVTFVRKGRWCSPLPGRGSGAMGHCQRGPSPPERRPPESPHRTEGRSVRR